MTYKNHISITPLRLIGLINPGAELGYERYFGNKYSGKILYAYLHDFARTTPYENYEGVRVGVEAKRFVYQEEKLGAYASAEAIYNRSSFNSIYEFFPNDSPTSWRGSYLDSIFVRNENLSLNFKVGMQVQYHRLMLEIFGGVGIKHKRLTHEGRINSLDHIHSRHPNIYSISAKEFDGLTMNLPLNVVISFCF